LVQPIIYRIFAALGMSIVTYSGMSLVMAKVYLYSQGAWNGLPSSILGLASMAGLGEGLSIVFGAIATRVMLWQLSKSTKMVMSNPA